MEILTETHCHSLVSDGLAGPDELVRTAEKKGLRALAVTDHTTFRGSALARRFARLYDSKVTVIYATEAYTSWGDILVYCESPLPEPLPRDPLELRDLARANNCVTAAPHPFHPYMPSVREKLMERPDVFDLVEVWNGRSLPIFNVRAIRAARTLGKPAISGSDAHVPAGLGVSPARIVTGGERLEDILEAMRKGSIIPTVGIYGLRALIQDAAWSLFRAINGIPAHPRT